MRLVLFLILFNTTAAAADERSALYGLWGTEQQCARLPILAGGTKQAAPFEVRPGWLRHDTLWCRLTWFPLQPRPDGLFVGTRAVCGEDSLRGYRLDFALFGSELRLIWDESLINGPLRRCKPAS